jgi:putative transposase
MSRRSYGSPRVHAELRLGLGTCCSRKRVERLMRQAGVAGIHRLRRGGCTRRDGSEPRDDLVGRQFDPTGPDRLWVMDVTEQPTGDGKVYLAVVLDAFSRRVVGWSIADHIRSELVVDAVRMALWRRRPPAGQTVPHSDHGSQLDRSLVQPAPPALLLPHAQAIDYETTQASTGGASRRVLCHNS